MKLLVVDVEGDSEGHVFNYSHKLYMLGLHNGQQSWQFPIEWYPGKPYGQYIQEAQEIIDTHDLLVGANFKHDMLWCRRYGLKLQKHKVWCLQYAEFCLSGQTWRYPDLDTACKNRGIEGKIPWDWSKPFNEYPWEQAAAYNAKDLEIEYTLFLAQVEALKDKSQLKRLIWNGCQDLQVTAEMEWNGIKYDSHKSLMAGHPLLARVRGLEEQLRSLVGFPELSCEKPRHLSAILYGGRAVWPAVESYTFTYKDAARGSKVKTRNVVRERVFPRLVEPLRGSENANGYSTEEGILKRLRATSKAKEIVDTLLEIRGLNKLVSTYYHGIPNLAVEMGWESDIIHGQLNHCVTQTGRLASAKPNLQNIEYGVRECIVTRYPLS